MICGFGDFLGLSVLSMTSESSWRSRSSDARLRAWFCIRGRSVEERAINNSGTGKQRDAARLLAEDTTSGSLAPKGAMLVPKRNGPDLRRAVGPAAVGRANAIRLLPAVPREASAPRAP